MSTLGGDDVIIRRTWCSHLLEEVMFSLLKEVISHRGRRSRLKVRVNWW